MEFNDSEFVTCPYDRAHRVPKSRIQGHLIKCQKKNPPLLVCPYNATHRYTDDQMKVHLSICPNKPLKPYKQEEFRGGKINTPKPILQREYLPETDPNHECWDD